MSQIPNPAGAFGYSTALDGQSYQNVREFQANGAIAEGDAVVFVEITADAGGLPKVAKATVASDDPTIFVGIALEAAAAAGDIVRVVVGGLALANIGDSTITFGQVAEFHGATNGALKGSTHDNTDIVGDSMGVFLSANDIGGTNKAFLWVGKL